MTRAGNFECWLCTNSTEKSVIGVGDLRQSSQAKYKVDTSIYYRARYFSIWAFSRRGDKGRVSRVKDIDPSLESDLGHFGGDWSCSAITVWSAVCGGEVVRVRRWMRWYYTWLRVVSGLVVSLVAGLVAQWGQVVAHFTTCQVQLTSLSGWGADCND